jgi:hypothetical protein
LASENRLCDALFVVLCVVFAVDFEDEIEVDSPERDGLTALVQESSQTFHAFSATSQVTMDVAWSPDCIDGRCYDYGAIIDAVNFAFVMAYDEQSQIFPPRICQVLHRYFPLPKLFALSCSQLSNKPLQI